MRPRLAATAGCGSPRPGCARDTRASALPAGRVVDAPEKKRRSRWPDQPVSVRFWSKVSKDGPVPECAPHLGSCWIWTAARFRSGGYGAFNPDGVTVRAHRWAYAEARGSVPDGLVLDHLCRVPACVRPDHLEAVTPTTNCRRGLRGALRTHCPQGHPLSGENLCPWEPHRKCWTCKRARERATTQVKGAAEGAVAAEAAA